MLQEVLPYVLTAGGTLAATSLVQIHVVPRVESRKRFEDRWEKDVRQLGETLAFELPDAEQRLVEAVRIEVLVSARNDSADPQRLLQARQEQEVRVAAATGDYARIRIKIDWLIQRITGASGRREMGLLRGASVQMAQAEMAVWPLREERQLSPAEGDEMVDALQTARKSLADATETLADQAPPPDVRRPSRRKPRLPRRRR